MSFYQTGILNAIKGVTKEVYFHYMNISKEELEEIFKACSQVDKLTISNSKLDLSSKLDIKGAKYTMQHLSFRWCGRNHSNNWSSKSERFRRLVKYMSKTSLLYSLKTINIFCCGITKDSTIQILEEFKMGNVKIVLT